LTPAGSHEAGFRGDVCKSSVVIIAVEVTGGSGSGIWRFEPGTVHQKNIGPTVVVVVKDGHAGAGGFDDVFLGGNATEDLLHGEARLFRHVNEVGNRLGWGGLWLLAFSGNCERKQDCHAGKFADSSASTGTIEWHDLF